MGRPGRLACYASCSPARIAPTRLTSEALLKDLTHVTRDFGETVQARARTDPAFRAALLTEGVECLLAGEVEPGEIVMRDYLKATLALEAGRDR